MSKTIMIIELPEPKVRKQHAPPAKAHRKKTTYSRKRKHKNRPDEGAFFIGKASQSPFKVF